MKQAEVNKLAEALRAAGKSESEIRSALFNTKGVKISQIKKAGI